MRDRCAGPHDDDRVQRRRPRDRDVIREERGGANGATLVTENEYDAAGRRIACARSGDAMSVADTIAYAYNARGELTNALSNVDANYAYAYQYDDIGNRTPHFTISTTATKTYWTLSPETDPSLPIMITHPLARLRLKTLI